MKKRRIGVDQFVGINRRFSRLLPEDVAYNRDDENGRRYEEGTWSTRKGNARPDAIIPDGTGNPVVGLAEHLGPDYYLNMLVVQTGNISGDNMPEPEYY